MQHKVKVTVIDKKLYPKLQEKYCADPAAGACPCYNVGDEFIFERYGDADDFWHIGINTLKQTVNAAEGIAGGASYPHCSEAWDAIARYIYTGLQGGSIMRGWMNDEKIMIACCSDGTRPVIFKIERMDYKVLYIDNMNCDQCREKVRAALMSVDQVCDVVFKDDYTEVYLQEQTSDEVLSEAVERFKEFAVTKIE